MRNMEIVGVYARNSAMFESWDAIIREKNSYNGEYRSQVIYIPKQIAEVMNLSPGDKIEVAIRRHNGPPKTINDPLPSGGALMNLEAQGNKGKPEPDTRLVKKEDGENE